MADFIGVYSSRTCVGQNRALNQPLLCNSSNLRNTSVYQKIPRGLCLLKTHCITNVCWANACSCIYYQKKSLQDKNTHRSLSEMFKTQPTTADNRDIFHKLGRISATHPNTKLAQSDKEWKRKLFVAIQGDLSDTLNSWGYRDKQNVSSGSIPAFFTFFMSN